MTGEEFRAALAQRGLTIRAAAEVLGHAPGSIQRWLKAGPPDEVATAIVNVPSGEQLDDVIYALGCVAAVVESTIGRRLKESEYTGMAAAPARTLGPLVARMFAEAKTETRRKTDTRLTELMAQLPSSGLPAQVSAARQSSFWLGYYQERARLHERMRSGRVSEQPGDAADD